MPTNRDMISFYGIERQIYLRLLSLGSPVSTARSIISLWIFLQFIGIELVNYIRDLRDDSRFALFVVEAESILGCIETGSVGGDGLVAAIPLTAAMAFEVINMRFFVFNKDVIARGMDYVMRNIGPVIFPRSHSNDLSNVYRERIAPNPEDIRTLFITFQGSSGLREEDIIEFFERRWGSCVENVMLEGTTRDVVPIYGRILLVNEYFVEMIFCQRPLLVMETNGGEMVVRKFSVS